MDGVLLRLSELGADDDVSGSPITAEELDFARDSIQHLQDADDAAAFWASLSQAGTSAVAFTKVLGNLVRDANTDNALIAATFYTYILRLNGCPVSCPR